MAAGPWGWGLAVLLLLLAVLRCAARRLRSRSATNSAAVSRDDDVSALLVTAHPDDEVMFFAPTLLCLGRAGARLAVLCCSAGERGCGRERWGYLAPQVPLAVEVRLPIRGVTRRPL